MNRPVFTLLFFTCYDLTTFFGLTWLRIAYKLPVLQLLLKIAIIPNFLTGSIKSPGTLLFLDWVTITFTRNFQESRIEHSCEQIFALGFATLS